MAHMGRHYRPHNEAKQTGCGPKPASVPAARAILALSALALTFTVSSQAAFAQQTGEKTSLALPSVAATTILPPQNAQATQDFNFNMPEAVSTRMLDLNLDFDSIGCLVGEQNCLRDEAPIDLGFSTSLSKNSKKGLDLELVPTASMRFDDDSRSAVVGAVVRIGEDLRSKDVASNTWYVFAGADAEALSYSPESAAALTRGEFGLSDRIIIGDAQAGVGYRIGSADVSLGYFRREVSTLGGSLGTEGFSKTEDAAALSFTWKR